MAIVTAMAVPHPPIILPEIGRGEEKKIAKASAAITSNCGAGCFGLIYMLE